MSAAARRLAGWKWEVGERVREVEGVAFCGLILLGRRVTGGGKSVVRGRRAGRRKQARKGSVQGEEGRSVSSGGGVCDDGGGGGSHLSN